MATVNSAPKTTSAPVASKSNKVTFADCIAAAQRYGTANGEGRDSWIKLFLDIHDWTDQGAMTSKNAKDAPDGVDRVRELCVNFVKASNEAAVTDGKAGRKITDETMDNKASEMRLAAKLAEKDGVNGLLVIQNAFTAIGKITENKPTTLNGLTKVVRSQLKVDKQLSAKEISAALAPKEGNGEPTAIDAWKALAEQASIIASGKEAKGNSKAKAALDPSKDASELVIAIKNYVNKLVEAEKRAAAKAIAAANRQPVKRG